MSDVRNVVLVHGGFVDGSGWQGVYDRLTAEGFNVSVVQNQTLSLESDVETTDNVLDLQDGPAILVGHSYGGAVITEAGNHDRVAGLVYIAAFAPELDIVVFAPRAGSVTESSVLTRKIFEAAAGHNLHLAVAELPIQFWEGSLGAMKRDRNTISCLRSVLMKPEHFDWVERIWEILAESTREVFDRPH